MSSSGGFASGTTPWSPTTAAPARTGSGPYPSREAAARALEKVEERNKEWDAQDR